VHAANHDGSAPGVSPFNTGHQMSATLPDTGFLDALNAHKGILYKVANVYCSRSEDRADLIQDIIVELWRAWPRFDATKAQLSTWMYKIAMNVAISAQRGDQRYIRDAQPLDGAILDLAAADAELASGDDDLHALRQLLVPFDPISRSMVLLYVEGYGHDEIAELTGLTPSNVSTRMHRIKQKLSRESALAGAQS
jgi:RNA polymerase sigma factor (sigma-70 family)